MFFKIVSSGLVGTPMQDAGIEINIECETIEIIRHYKLAHQPSEIAEHLIVPTMRLSTFLSNIEHYSTIVCTTREDKVYKYILTHGCMYQMNDRGKTINSYLINCENPPEDFTEEDLNDTI